MSVSSVHFISPTKTVVILVQKTGEWMLGRGPVFSFPGILFRKAPAATDTVLLSSLASTGFSASPNTFAQLLQ